MSFFEHYELIYGQRWKAIWEALSKNEFKVARATLESQSSLELKHFTQNGDFNDCFYPPTCEGQKAQALYYLDFASIVAARALGARPCERVLDMCAAPGGKALVLSFDMKGQGLLVCNEPSRQRRERLKRVLREHVDESNDFQIQVKGLDGTVIGMRESENFDRILIDAPCSGERHLLAKESELKKWTAKRSKRLAARQYGLLCSGLLALKKGGHMLYSTCSLSPFENDEVIAKLLKKKGEYLTLDNDQVWQRWGPLEGMERTPYGFRFLPDTSPGMGPLYFSLLKKL